MNSKILEIARTSNLAELYDRYQNYCMKNADDDIISFEEVVNAFSTKLLTEVLRILVTTEGNDKTVDAIWDLAELGIDVSEALDSFGDY